MLHPVVLDPDDGPALDMGPLERIVFKAVGSKNAGAFDLLDVTTQPGGGPPEQVHHRNDEAYFVLDGVLRIKLGTDHFTTAAGSFIFVPRDTPHAFGNTSTEPARMLVFITPGGIQGLL